MRIKVVVNQQQYVFYDPVKAQAAIDGFAASAERYRAKAQLYGTIVHLLTTELQKALEDKAAKAAAKKAAKKDQ